MTARLATAALDSLRANALRFLAIDAVESAKSGHPGLPMGMAEIAVALWTRHLRHDPADPAWADRDRFVLSNGHGSMLLYALLHLTGYDLPIDEIRRFRQLDSRCPGHPEVGHTPGVETTTGPLGQGLANAVGMALAEKRLAAEFNRPGHTVVDHRSWVFLGDGCLMEGISHEAASIAGVQRLSKLICLWDDNHISIDGDVAGWFADDTPARFRAYGWNVVERVDGHQVEAVDRAIREALANADNDIGPTLICCRTTIGRGSPARAGSAGVHGAPLGADEVAATRAALDWPHAPFVVPDEIRASFDARAHGARRQAEWQTGFDAYRTAHPALAAEFQRRQRGDLPVSWRVLSTALLRRAHNDATSVASGSPCGFLSTVWCRITRPLSLPLSNTPSTVESAVMSAASGNGLWKVMSRSPSTTITRLSCMSPGPEPHAATDAKVGTTLSGRGVKQASLTNASSFSSIGSAPSPMP